MGTPYVMLASCIPPHRTGVYMGIFNMMIVIPMLLNAMTWWIIYDDTSFAPLRYLGLGELKFNGLNLLGGDARNALMLAGVLLIFAALAVLRVRDDELGT
jgi:maltose/moltooligosaccharide transporter